MKGVILAGGSGSRLHPCTNVTNKHLLPIYDKPMIYYPLETLISGGINDILIVSGREHVGDFSELLGSGSDFGVDLTYKVQEGAGGIAQALGLAKNFVGNDFMAVLLGDNIFQENIQGYVSEFEKQKKGARIFLKEVPYEDAKRFGCATINSQKKIVNYVEEKPKIPKSNLAMTGLYMFDNSIFNIISELKPSHRKELEITDAIREYVLKDLCFYNLISGFWSDAGTHESLFKSSQYIRNFKKKNI